MRYMSVAEQRYQAVLAVISDGRSISEVAVQWGVDRRTVHRWLGRYEAGGRLGIMRRQASQSQANEKFISRHGS
ncbi:MAG TPA: helix-turn-helix domain-containing protein [Candidatus Dormibacteraeota bacterium]|nr:helix-turn-helix domain-containing protein [Candidatus Dormibacteraeota bacterium]HVC24043.1 helix-turn-helix domain-containing protein [Candidatus Dormibacteraeota bacterium]